MTTSNFPSATTPPPYKRSVKNYLIDSRFQLKYTGFIVGVALLISGVMGAFLYTTSRTVISESQRVVAFGKAHAAPVGHERTMEERRRDASESAV